MESALVYHASDTGDDQTICSGYYPPLQWRELLNSLVLDVEA